MAQDTKRKTWGRLTGEWQTVPPEAYELEVTPGEERSTFKAAAPLALWIAILAAFVTSHPWLGALVSWLLEHVR